MPTMKFRKLSYALGAEVIGADLTNLDDDDFAEIHEAYLTYSLLAFRGQHLSTAQHLEFAARFGDVDPRDDAMVNNHPEHRGIMRLHYPAAGSHEPSVPYQGEWWHTDISFRPNPPSATIFRAVVVPPVGGDTMFANQYIAYEELSEGMRHLADGLEAVHIGGGNRIDHSTPERERETRRQNQTVHPLVRVHPETERRSLYLGGDNMKFLLGFTAHESAPFFRLLMDHATRDQFTYRHQWQADDIVMWDNRCLLHRAVGDFDRTYERTMEHCTIVGTPFGTLYDGVYIPEMVGMH